LAAASYTDRQQAFRHHKSQSGIRGRTKWGLTSKAPT
jgi:hypothetical protein